MSANFPSAKRATVSCDNAYYYRSADGTCNNLDNPSWGAADQTYQRLLDPVYDDGKYNGTSGQPTISTRDCLTLVPTRDCWTLSMMAVGAMIHLDNPPYLPETAELCL